MRRYGSARPPKGPRSRRAAISSTRASLVQIIGGEPQAVAVRDGKGTEGIPAKHARIIRSLIAVRDAVREVLRAQANDEPWGSAQIRLRSAYALFVRNFGPINLTTISETVTAEGETRETFRRPNLQPFLDDPDVWLVASIEDYDLESGTAKPGPIFRERVLHPETTPVIETAEDALAVTLHETGLVDLDRIAELLGRSRETAIAELGERIFADPEATAAMNRDVWVTADAYLSGKIRDKLTAAQAAAALDPRYQRNVAALEKTLPEDLKPSDITARLGAPWIPADVVAAFAEEVLGVKTPVYHTVEIASWSINVHAFAGQASSSTDWGTSRRHAGELLMDALNASLPQIYDEFEEDGVKKRVLNAADTEAAKDKLMKIKAAFETWVWKDVERADRLARIYNDRFNNLVPRHFDGSHLTIPGASSVISFYAHQKRAIWRIVASGTTYVAHAVGAGKTFSLAAAIMEQKRLGLITKAMMVVPGHCLAQASREFLQLYPTARILVADETNFVKDKRQRFLARAATAQWDCIIITHSAFKFIPAPAEFERRLISQQMQSYSELLERIDGADRLSRKRIERMKEGLEEDLERLKSRKDDMLTIAEIGVDQLIVDEMQEFRKLSFATNQTTLKGIDPDGSQRAWDLYVKTRFIDATKNPGRALVAASGTPITNSLAELFTLQRFIQPDALQERGIQEFDAWAANFGETRTELELQPSGLYKPVTRFCEFVNVPDLMAIYRMATDVVLKSDLRQYLKLPAIAGGRRQIVAAPASEAFLGYQRHLAERIKAIENRSGKPQKGDDILLSVITDGRHAAIDLRFVRSGGDNEPDNKLNALIDNVHRIWEQTANNRYTRLDGIPYALARRGADDLFRPRHAGRRRNPWLLRLSLDQGFPCRPRRAIGSDRLHAGLQEVLGETAPVQRRQWRPGPHPDRLVARPWAPASTPSGGSKPCTISTCRGCPRRSSSARAGSSGRATRTRRSSSTLTRPSAASTPRAGRSSNAKPASSTPPCLATAPSAGSRTPDRRRTSSPSPRRSPPATSGSCARLASPLKSPGSSACATAISTTSSPSGARSTSAKSGSKTRPAGSRRSPRTSPEEFRPAATPSQ